MLRNNIVSQPLSGIGYVIKGAKLILNPKLRSFVLIPLLINILIFSTAFYFLFNYLISLIEYYINLLPDFLSWLSYILGPILVLTILFAFSFIFTAIANVIAAPFNGLLAEKTEALLTGSNDFDGGTMVDLLKDLPRILMRELKKITYFLPRMLLCFVLFFVPAVGQTVAPIIWFVFAGWMMAIQYADFPFDNHKISFKLMKESLSKKLSTSLSFGMSIGFLSSLPFVNFVIMPIAVCGATAFWVDSHKPSFDGKELKIKR